MFENLGHLANIISLPEIGSLGVKRAKFNAYAAAGESGPFVYLDADIIVLKDLSSLLADERLSGCRDDLAGCPFILNPEFPWPGDTGLRNTRYINSGVVGFGNAVLPLLNEWQDRVSDNLFWNRYIHADGLYDNHVLCALLEMYELDVRYLSEKKYNWQGYLDSSGEIAAEASDGTLVNKVSREELHLVHFAGIKDVSSHLDKLPIRVSALLDEKSLPPTDTGYAISSIRSAFQRSIHSKSDVKARQVSVLINATRTLLDGPEYLGFSSAEAHAMVNVTLEVPKTNLIWNGLRCGGKFLTADEYVDLRDLAKRLEFDTVLTVGDPEVGILFSQLAKVEDSFFSVAVTNGDNLADASTAELSSPQLSCSEGDGAGLSTVLERLGSVDAVFLGSVDTFYSRKETLARVLSSYDPRFIFVHNARRDLLDLLDVLPTGAYSVTDTIQSHRGLVVLQRGNSRIRPIDMNLTPTEFDQGGLAELRVVNFHEPSGDFPIARVQVRNISTRSWHPDGSKPVRLSYHLLHHGRIVEFDGIRTEFPCRVDPGDELEMDVPVDLTNLNNGSYSIAFRVLQEGVAWFRLGSEESLASVSISRSSIL